MNANINNSFPASLKTVLIQAQIIIFGTVLVPVDMENHHRNKNVKIMSRYPFCIDLELYEHIQCSRNNLNFFYDRCNTVVPEHDS